MKQCNSCGQLLSNSAKKCFKCGSIDLARGTVSDGNPDIPKKEYNGVYGAGNVHQCPVCKFPVTINGQTVECPTCGEYLYFDDITRELNSFNNEQDPELNN